MAQNFVKTLLALKSTTAALILNSLSMFYALSGVVSYYLCLWFLLEEITSVDVPHMYYINFGDRITGKNQVVVDNWPLKKFCSPVYITTKNKVDVLLQAWTKGTAKFRSLSDKEWCQWQLNRAEALTEESLAGRDEMEDDEMEDEGVDKVDSEPPLRDFTSTVNINTQPATYFHQHP